MADETATIQLIIEAQNRAQSTLDDINKRLDLFTRSAGGATGANDLLAGSAEGAAEALAGQAGIVGRLVAATGSLLTPLGLVTVGVAAFATAALAASKSIGEFQQHQDILADELGLTQKELGGLTLAAANVGKSISAAQPALFRFSRLLGDAQSGGESAAKAFRNLGVSVTDSEGKTRPFSDVLSDVSVSLSKVGNAADRNRMLFELFGRSGVQILPILKQKFKELGAEAEDMGLVLSESSQETAREAEKAWSKLGASVTGLKNTILVTLAPAGTAITNFAVQAIKDLKEFGKSIEETADGLKVLNELGKPTVDFGPITTLGVRTTASKAYDYAGTLATTAPTEGPMLTSEMKARIDAEEAYNKVVKEQAEKRKQVEEDSNLKYKGSSFTAPGYGEFAGDEMIKHFQELEFAEMNANKGMLDALNGTIQWNEEIGRISPTLQQASSSTEYLRSSVSSSVSGFVSDAVLGFATVGNAFHSLIRSMVGTIAETVIQSVVKGFITAAAVATTGGAVRPSAVVPGGVNITINANGHFIDRKSLQAFASEELVPVVLDTMNRGAYRGL